MRADPLPLQARIERHPRGRLALSALIALVLAAVTFSNLVALDVLHGRTVGLVERSIRVVSLHQNWSMFAPPPRASPTLLVDVRHDDGTTTRWRRPGLHRGQYRAYRWGKLEEAMIVRRNPQVLVGFTRWIASHEHAAGGTDGVRLRERWRLLNPPGPGPAIAHEHVHELEPLAPGPRPERAGETV